MSELFNFTVLADTHYYSPSLGTSGRAYELRSGSDQKLLGGSGAVIDALFKRLAASGTDAVLIAGDLTNNGERISHMEFREKLRALARSVAVYVITATHDWCSNGKNNRYVGDRAVSDVPVFSADELSEFYREFGLDGADSSFVNDIGCASYAAPLGERLMLLALNDDGAPGCESGYSEEHLRWIELQCARAAREGRGVAAMQHHLITPHVSPLLWGGACIRNRREVSARFADAGIRLIFEGHTHIQNITQILSPSGNELSAVNVSSVVGYPGVISRVSLDSEGALRLRTEKIGSFVVDGATHGTDFLEDRLRSLIFNVIEAARGADRRDFSDKLSALDLGGVSPALAFFFLRPLISSLAKADIASLCLKLNRLTLGRAAFDRERALKFEGVRAADLAFDVVLALFDGIPRCREGDDLYELIMSAVRLPKLLSRRRVFTSFENAVKEIITGGSQDNNCLTIDNFIDNA